MARGKKTGGGSRRGIPNRATASAREALGMLVDANVGDLQSWLNEIKRKEGARAAWECFMSLVEFSVPKLMRSELRVGPAAPTGLLIVDDAVEAANIYERIMRGDLAIDAVRFEPTSEHGVRSEPIASTPSGQAAEATSTPINRQLASSNGARDG